MFRVPPDRDGAGAAHAVPRFAARVHPAAAAGPRRRGACSARPSRKSGPSSVLLADGSEHSQRHHGLGGRASRRRMRAGPRCCRAARAAGSRSRPTCGSPARTASSPWATSASTSRRRSRSWPSPRFSRARHAGQQMARLLAGQARPSRSGITTRASWPRSAAGRPSSSCRGGLRLRGTLAWLAWLGLHLLYLLGSRNRLVTFVNLSWRYLTWSRGGGVIVGDDVPDPK